MRHQNNLSDEQGGTWRAPRSSAPPPRDDTPEICSVCDSGYTCDSPVRVLTPEISLHPLKKPIFTHTHTFTRRSATPPRAREGVQSGLRCKTPPACFNFHLPHHDPLQLVTQVASRSTSLLFFSSPVCPPQLALFSSHSLLFTAIDFSVSHKRTRHDKSPFSKMGSKH